MPGWSGEKNARVENAKEVAQGMGAEETISTTGKIFSDS